MKISHRITISKVIAAVAIVVLAVSASKNIDDINTARIWVDHTLKVIIEKETMESAVKDLESRTRGYAATGDERFMDGTEELKRKAERGFNSLKTLTADNPTQQANLAELSPLLAKRIAELDRIARECKDHGPESARKLLKLPEDGATWNWNRVTQKIKTEEETLLNARTAEVLAQIKRTETAGLVLAGIFLAIVIAIGVVVVRGISRSIKTLVEGTERVAAGDSSFRIPVNTTDEMATLGRAFNTMIEKLRVLSEKQDDLNWHRLNLNNVSALLEGHRDVESASNVLLLNLIPLLESHQAAFYLVYKEGRDQSLRMVAGYGFSDNDVIDSHIKFGEGLVGQAARDGRKVILRDVHPDNYVIKSALTSSKPLEVVILPLVFEGKTIGVLELASLTGFSEKYQTFLDELSERIALSFNSISTSAQVDHLLMESQTLVEELQAQQEELESQQDELRTANEELEDKAEALDYQNQEISDKNSELEQMQTNLEEKANELALASKYKSEFLANMSHDLRTPLNSLLIFSELLSENDDKNLLEFQVEYAQNIHAAGKTLLSLIDDILDLSKIESGTVVLDNVDVAINDIVSEMQRQFELTAESKGVQFIINVADDVPEIMRTDRKRLSQLLTNLLSNAFKFTEKGSVQLIVSRLAGTAIGGQISRGALQFQIIDTGIGISKDKHDLVFEAFRQADGSIKRKYGGTGLGLAICRQLSELLGGHIDLQSTPGEGSIFTVDLPIAYEGKRELPVSDATALLTNPISANRSLERTLESHRDFKMMMQSELDDDRRIIEPGDRVLLMIEDDPHFARMLLDTARKHAFKGVVALTGQEGLALARKIQPDGITLDLRLPDMEGWVVLDQLKFIPETKHIPVHIISVDKERQRSLESGAIGFLEKPVSIKTLSEAISTIKAVNDKVEGKILLVETEERLREKLTDVLSDTDVIVEAVPSSTGVIETLAKSQEPFDCIVIDIDLKDANSIELIEDIQKRSDSKPPILIYCERDLSDEDKAALARLRQSSTIKDVNTPERLLSEAVLFLHRVEASLPENKRIAIDNVRQNEQPLVGRKVLIVDDDPRNIAALTGALQKQKMELLFAENGKEAIDKLSEEPGIELILMDMMMPVMDGYEAMREIRTMEKFRRLPIIAVTAKAMKEDRRKCLEAGASDYITKPVDRSQLLSLLRVWLYKR